MQHPSSLTVSVVIPAYNVEGYVCDAVTSALQQTYPLQEIVCVDDGSTDGTLEVLRGLEAKHPERIQVLTGPNQGASTARNKGLERATGDYIQFLDADDMLLPEKIERDVDLLKEGGESLLFGGYESFEHEEKVHERSTYVSEDPWVCLTKQNFGHTSSNLFRADAVKQVGGWDEDRPFNQDYDLIARMLKDGAEVAFAHHKCTHVRGREDSISADFGKEMRTAQAELDRDILRYLRSVDADEESIAAIEDFVFNKLRQLYRFDPETAVRLHHETFPEGHDPAVDVGNTAAYCAVYRLLGFSVTERLKTVYQQIRS